VIRLHHSAIFSKEKLEEALRRLVPELFARG
jgi:hypothetical protein